MLKLNESFQIQIHMQKDIELQVLKAFEFIDINHYIVGNTNLSAEKGDNYRFSSTYSIKNKNYKALLKVLSFTTILKIKLIYIKLVTNMYILIFMNLKPLEEI